MVLSEFEDKLQSILGNPEAMDQIMSIARSLTGNTSAQDVPDSSVETSPAPFQPTPCNNESFDLLNGVDPRILQLGMRLLSEYNNDNNNTVALLIALQPFLREERHAKVDKAIQIAKLSRLIRIALESFRKGGDDFV